MAAIEGPELADRLGPVLEAAGPDGLTPSAAGRAAGLTTGQAHQGLRWMVANQFARTTGNGARARYHTR